MSELPENKLKNKKRIRNLEKRQAVLRTSRSKIADRKKTEKRKTERRKSQKRSIVRKKKSVVREKKVERRLAVKAASDLRSSQDKQNKINEETLKLLDGEFDKEHFQNDSRNSLIELFEEDELGDIGL